MQMFWKTHVDDGKPLGKDGFMVKGTYLWPGELRQ